MKKSKSIWSFIKRRKVGNTSQLTSLPASPTASYYSTLDLPLDNFIRIQVEGDLRYLIISGTPTIQELFSAWKAIEELFLDAMRDKEGLYKTRLLDRINTLKVRYKLAQLCLEFLSIAYSPIIEQQLKDLVHMETRLDPNDKPAYIRILQVVRNRCQRMEIDYETYEAEYNMLKKDKKAGEQAVTYQQFDRMIAQVSHFMKFAINKKSTTTGEFAAYRVQMQEHQDYLQSQLKRRA